MEITHIKSISTPLVHDRAPAWSAGAIEAIAVLWLSRTVLFHLLSTTKKVDEQFDPKINLHLVSPREETLTLHFSNTFGFGTCLPNFQKIS